MKAAPDTGRRRAHPSEDARRRVSGGGRRLLPHYRPPAARSRSISLPISHRRHGHTGATVVGRRQPRQWPVASGLCSAKMWRTADEVKVAASTSAMLWIWSLGSLATGGDPITCAAGCSDPQAVPRVHPADLAASSPSLFPATPLLLSPVDAPCSLVPPTVRVWCDPGTTSPER